MATAAIPRTTVKSRTGILEWLTTVDHKKIGLLYIVTSFLFFLMGGIMRKKYAVWSGIKQSGKKFPKTKFRLETGKFYKVQ